ncbi:hypothetical protein VY86_12395 [Photorhabdus thracensis]|uniref:Uncharacterized protein n=1 Tax=Photorhabdus thracensis TaxID=230089 RepID=A0A0F7LLG0_9GAMM|nr:hypothetical protein VY86_12395 [Photorhabdus thracensis]
MSGNAPEPNRPAVSEQAASNGNETEYPCLPAKVPPQVREQMPHENTGFGSVSDALSCQSGKDESNIPHPIQE